MTPGVTRLPLLAQAAAVVAPALCAGMLARRVSRQHAGLSIGSSLRDRPLLGLLCVPPVAIIAFEIVAALVPEMQWAMPLWLELVHAPAAWALLLASLAFGFGFVAVLALIRRHRDRWKLALAGLLSVVAVEVSFIQQTAPVAGELGASEDDGVVLQTSGVSCAAASAANLARAHGLPATEKEMAARLGTSASGTSSAELVRGLRPLGFMCERIEQPDPEALPVPVILYIDHPAAGKESHAVLLSGKTGGRFVVLDPLVGRRSMSLADLQSRWHGHGVACRRIERP
jgi:hypothetical protein